MKALRASIAVTILGVICTSCQILSPFVVANLSNETLEITLELKPGKWRSAYQMIPAVESLDEFESVRWNLFRNLNENDFIFDREQGVLKVLIEPRQVIVVDRKNMGYVELDPSEHFDIKRLVMKGSQGSITLEDDNLHRQFEPEGLGRIIPGGYVYVFRYK